MNGNKIHLPFDNIKFYLSDKNPNEVIPKYRCDDCYCIMETPHYWRFAPFQKDQEKRGYHFWCKDCYELRGGKV